MIRKRIPKESLVPGMKVRNTKTKMVGIVRGKMSDPSELATAKEGFVKVLVSQNRPDFPHRIVEWDIRLLVVP